MLLGVAVTLGSTCLPDTRTIKDERGKALMGIFVKRRSDRLIITALAHRVHKDERKRCSCRMDGVLLIYGLKRNEMAFRFFLNRLAFY